METFLFLNVISLTPIILTNMLTFKSWYEREDAASSIVEWLKSAVIAAILSLSIAFLYDIAFSEAMREVYKIVTIWEFVIFAYVSSLFTFWIIKKIDKIFILLSVTSFSALFMFITPLMFSLLEIDNVSLIAILSFGFGGFIGSGVAVGVNKDIKLFGICIAFVLLCAFAGVALASARWHVEEWESVHAAVDNAVIHSYEKSCGYNI